MGQILNFQLGQVVYTLQRINSMNHEKFNFTTLEQILQKASELNLFFHVSSDFSCFWKPIKTSAIELENRFVIHPMEGCDGKNDGSPDELTYRRYQRFALSGASVIWVEATSVVKEGRASPRQLWLHKDNIRQFINLLTLSKKAAREIYGNSFKQKYILQLTHSGRYSRPDGVPCPVLTHRNPILDKSLMIPFNYPIITDSELERLEDSFVEAARYAYESGFDGVDIKSCHRYLISDLLGAYTREGSKYGGTFENRTRFLLNVIDKIKNSLPQVLITTRLNVYDGIAYPYGFGVDKENEKKPDLTEPLNLIKELSSRGVNLISISVGTPYYNPHINRPYDTPILNGYTPQEHPLEGIYRFISLVDLIQTTKPESIIVGAGYSWLRQFFPYFAAGVLHKKAASLIGIGRLALAYPECLRDLREKGFLDPKKVCQTCSCCSQIMRDGGQVGCVLRDSSIYSPIFKAVRSFNTPV